MTRESSVAGRGRCRLGVGALGSPEKWGGGDGGGGVGGSGGLRMLAWRFAGEEAFDLCCVGFKQMLR